MRSEYQPDEVAALVETLKLLSAEIERNTAVITAGLNHLKGCESEPHRAAVALQVATSTSNILVHLRYCGWIEAELTPTRVFAEPKEILATFVETQEKLAEEFRVKQEAEKTPPGDTSVGENPVPVPPVVQEPVVFTADEQDSRVNAPFPLTKQ